jgi:hypothetical protein
MRANPPPLELVKIARACENRSISRRQRAVSPA